MLFSCAVVAPAFTGQGLIVRPRTTAGAWLLPTDRRARVHVGDNDWRSAPDLCLNTVVLPLCARLEPTDDPVRTSSLALSVGVDCVSAVMDTRFDIFVTRGTRLGLASTLAPIPLGVMGLRGKSEIPGN